MGLVEVGMRVVRGPDWRWGEQDGGEGHAGTVVEVGRPGSSTTPDRTVVVQWDAGSRTNYRIGYQSSFDLRLVDNAPVGVRHQNHICDGCKKQGIAGIRWKCARCFDYDLCTSCYMGDKHDVNHPFIRYETSSSSGVDISPRKNASKVPLQGIFVGAKVIRGPDWDWGNQDGGEGKWGRVTEIRGWDNESGRSVASVTWLSNTTNVYRVGHKGKVDVKYIQPATNGNIYLQHLPILGKPEDGVNTNGVSSASSAPLQLPFLVGERVRVAVPLEQLRTMQEGHGGWNQKMTEIIDKVGVVHRITDKGDVRVQYEGFPSRWTIHPGALTRVTSFSLGDIVTVISDASRVRDLQKGHGEWIDYMKSILGKNGVIAKVYPDGDLRVNIEGKTWTFNPLCVQIVPHNSEYNNTMKANERLDQTGPSVSSAPSTGSTEIEGPNSLVDQLVREAAQGHTQEVSQILTTHSDKVPVDGRSGGKTCLQVACHQGHLDLVRLLLHHNASLHMADDDGDTPLHYSAFGNQPEIMELLLRKGANINAINKGRCSALHVAVNKQHPACVKLLLKYNCDVNVQDSYGDTALHDAIGKNSIEILEMLGNSPHLLLSLKNKRGFNVLHHAALKGNNFATEKLVQRARQYVDVRKDDGFAALHLAALNGHRQVTETLLTLGRADPDLTNNKRQTPLLLAVSQGHLEVAEFLTNQGANVTAADEDGETALHLALQRQLSVSGTLPEFSPVFTCILNRLQSVNLENNYSLAMACFLVQKGASLTAVNGKGKTPLDFINDTAAIDILQSYTEQSSAPTASVRLDMDLRALDLAAESLRPDVAGTSHSPSRLPPFSECPATPPQHSISQPVSPAHRVIASAPSKIRNPPHNSLDTQEDEFHKFNGEAMEISNEDTEGGNCIICLESPSNVVFHPCTHCVTCEECSSRVKKCLTCRQVVLSKVTQDGRILSSKSRQPSAERLRYLETKIAEIEEAHSCSICMERRRSVAFLCGHGACVVCAHPLKTCHMCRKPITRKINLY
ncbi:UNVERIFIED_CONTAM: hypothetical protein RMT77_003819 [Armadillidium vulgare]